MKYQLLAHGWFVSPNNIHALQGDLMYPVSGPSAKAWAMACPGMEVQVLSDRIRVFKVEFFGEAYSCRSWHDTVTVAVFDDVDKFLAWVIGGIV